MPKNMSTDATKTSSRKVKNIEVLEPPEIIRIGMTMPKRLLDTLDQAAKLYGISRSELVQDACQDLTNKLLGTAWLEEMLQRMDIKYTSKKNPTYDVEKLISAIYEECPTNLPDVNQAVLTPKRLELIKNALQGRKSTDDPANKWLEFCNKCGLDPENIPKDKPVRITFETESDDDYG